MNIHLRKFSYFIERCCLNALSELDVENNDFWDDDDVL